MAGDRARVLPVTAAQTKSRAHGHASAVLTYVLWALVFALCSPSTLWAQEGTIEARTIVRRFVESMEMPSPDGKPLDGDALRRFYAAREFRPVWSGSHRSEQQAALTVEELSHANDEGLDPADYHVPDLTREIGATSDGEIAVRDVLLTDGVLRYAHDLRVGRVPPEQRGADVNLPSARYDAGRDLADALVNDRLSVFFADLPPPNTEYERLKTELAHYRTLALRGGWPRLPPGPEIKLDSGDPRLVILRARLAAEDSAAKTADIKSAVRLFQSRNGLEPDGRVGPRTQAMLNVSAEERVAQITANMERWRWLPRDLGERHIEVNVAGAELRAVDHGQSALNSRVIVGDRKHQSPIVRAVATAITVNPPWNVPRSIAVNEILPKLKRDRRYLISQNMVLLNGPSGDPHGVTIDWHSIRADAFPYRIQQLPGAANSLGRLKLEMPNSFDVYLHDTPARNLFTRADRALSHGCIRVQEVESLALFALAGDAVHMRGVLREAISSGKTDHIAISSPLPVYFLYWTAVTNADGSFGFRPDIYSRDRALIALLHGNRTRMPTAVSRACPGNRSTG